MPIPAIISTLARAAVAAHAVGVVGRLANFQAGARSHLPAQAVQPAQPYPVDDPRYPGQLR